MNPRAGRRGYFLALLLVVTVGTEVVSEPAFAHSMRGVEAELERSEPAARVTDEPLPPLALQDEGGAPVRLADLRGKVLVVGFDARGDSDVCKPASSLEAARALASEVTGLMEELRFVTVSAVRPGPDETLCGSREVDVSGTVTLYQEDREGSAGDRLGRVLGFGTDQTSGAIVVDSAGRIRARFHGSQFAPIQLMTYAAALAHDDHEAPGDGSTSGEPAGRTTQFVLGGVFALVGVSGYLVILRRRQRDRDRITGRDSP